MKIVRTLICYGLKQVIGDLAEKGVDFIAERFTDEGAALPQAVKAANERAWQALNLALAGDSYWEKFKRYALGDATQRALRQQIEPVLRDLAAAAKTQLEKVRAACLNDLMRLRRSREFKSNLPPVAELKREMVRWQHYTDPKGVIDGGWNAVAGVAAELEKDYPDLSRLLRQRVGEESPLLAALFSFFLRQEIAKNKELVAAITFDLVGNLSAAQENAFLEVGQTLATFGDKIEEIFDQLDRIETVGVQTHTLLLDIQAELQRQHSAEVHHLLTEVIAGLERLSMQRGVLSPRHSLSIHSENERNAVHGLLQQLRQLPVEQQRQVPALLNGLGKLLVGAGDFSEARRTFVDALINTPEPAAIARAEILFNGYRCALEERDWDGAFLAFQQAAVLDPVRFTFFPPHRYKAKGILGAGGFGTAFLCDDEYLKRRVVVKALHAEDVEGSVDAVFNEARVLIELSHEAIIRFRDCGFVDPTRAEHPFIVTDYFRGESLQAYVEKYGVLTPEQYRAIARQILSGMIAAHKSGVLHRDLKPDNILIRPEGEQFFVKIIDFGLAMRRQVVEESVAQAIAEPTLLGKSAVGTRRYSAPEQLYLTRSIPPGPYSDIYAFGKTSWFALFKTPLPREAQKQIVPELAALLDKCTKEHPEDRYRTFDAVAAELDGRKDRRRKNPEEGEKKLVEVLRDIFERTIGVGVEMDFTDAKKVCREYGISKERGQEITKKAWEQWQKAHPPKVKLPPPPPPPPGSPKDFALAKMLEHLKKKSPPLPGPPKDFPSPLVGKFVLAKANTFWMGDRGQQRQVRIPHDFYIGIHPVTQGQWEAIMANNPSYFTRNGGGKDKVRGISDADLKLFPVESVSCGDRGEFDVEIFIEKLNAEEPILGWVYRLPTEAEWEYICRGGASSQEQCTFDYYFEQATNEITQSQANFNNHLGRTSKVGSYKANALGVFDAHGNVWEWTADFDEEASFRVIRGGSWSSNGSSCRASYRLRYAPVNQQVDVGFRLVRVLCGS